MCIKGPEAAREHKIFVYFPYQFSTMKVFQNSNHGVIMAIPSPKFYKDFIFMANDEGDAYHRHLKAQLRWLITTLDEGQQWTEYFDVYNSGYIDMHVQFNSLQELIDIINSKDVSELKERQLKITERTMSWHWREVEQKWDEFFEAIF